MYYMAKSKKEAWDIVDRVFPDDYEEDTSCKGATRLYRSTRAKTDDDRWYYYICDCGDMLEMNMGPKTLRVWIDESGDDPRWREGVTLRDLIAEELARANSDERERERRARPIYLSALITPQPGYGIVLKRSNDGFVEMYEIVDEATGRTAAVIERKV